MEGEKCFHKPGALLEGANQATLPRFLLPPPSSLTFCLEPLSFHLGQEAEDTVRLLLYKNYFGQ